MTYQKMQPLIVTTSHRGVFLGYRPPEDGLTPIGDAIDLFHVRMCIAWPEEVRSVLGLASLTQAPTGLRIGPAALLMHVTAVTGVVLATEKAAGIWEKEPWS